jgi:molybdopterin/thiamine biosynthesis adenylyltransferase
VRITPIARRLADDELVREARRADVVIDATDNFESRAAINRACLAARTPLVYGAAIGFMGQVAVFRVDRDDEPCYQCLYPRTDYPVEPCSVFGVFTPIVGIIGSTQANEALKLLLDIGETLSRRMLLLDAEAMEWTTLRFAKDPACPTCGTAARGNRRESAETAGAGTGR